MALRRWWCLARRGVRLVGESGADAGAGRRRSGHDGARQAQGRASSPTCRTRRSRAARSPGSTANILTPPPKQPRSQGRAAADRLHRHARRRPVPPRRRHRSAASPGPQDRQKQGLFTDPPYYSPPAMAVHAGKKYSTIDDLRGQGSRHGQRVRVGQVDPGAFPGAKLHAYPDAQRRLQRPAAGRIQRRLPRPADHHRRRRRQAPGLTIQTEYLTPPTARRGQGHPGVRSTSRPTGPSFYLPKQEPKLGEGDLASRSTRCTQNGELADADQEVRRGPEAVPEADAGDGQGPPGRRPAGQLAAAVA